MARKLGIKAIKKALTECALDPNENLWFKIVAEANDDYCIRRANELLQEILAVNNTFDRLDKVIALLGLVKARYNDKTILNSLGSTNERVQA